MDACLCRLQLRGLQPSVAAAAAAASIAIARLQVCSNGASVALPFVVGAGVPSRTHRDAILQRLL
jgi:hypothetical protein